MLSLNLNVNRKLPQSWKATNPQLKFSLAKASSVSVFGYLSFLASNSAIANDFIALANHFGSSSGKMLSAFLQNQTKF